MPPPEHVAVVGAGLGGWKTVEGLRTAGHRGRISLIGAERHPPYDRPPLSKQLLSGSWGAERVRLAELDVLARLDVDVRLGVAVTGWSAAPDRHRLTLSDGTTIDADAVVVATGLAASTLPGQPASALVLRSLDDALALRDRVERAHSMIVVGGGFIGAEVASAALDRGVAVTVLEAAAVPAVAALGEQVAGLAARLMAESGVDLRCGVRVVGFGDTALGPGATPPGHRPRADPTAGSGAAVVDLADGTRLTADALVVGVGGTPQLDWAVDLELDTTNGLRCGPTGRVEGVGGAWAVGDVACWADRDTGGHGPRHEHWTSAADQAAAVAADIAGVDPPPAAVPYFWSDQFGLRIQLIGRRDDADRLIGLHGTGLDGGPVRGTVVGYAAGDRLTAVAGFGAARYLLRYRPLLRDGATARDASDLAATLR